MLPARSVSPASTPSAGSSLVDSAFAVRYVTVPSSAGSPIEDAVSERAADVDADWNTRASTLPIDSIGKSDNVTQMTSAVNLPQRDAPAKGRLWMPLE